jgi:magnesium-transporting ATPase (P-type)
MIMMNKMLFTVFAFQILLVILFASLSLPWTLEKKDKHDYLSITKKINGGSWFINFFTYWVAYSHMIPISLYVIIEMLKLG